MPSSPSETPSWDASRLLKLSSSATSKRYVRDPPPPVALPTVNVGWVVRSWTPSSGLARVGALGGGAVGPLGDDEESPPHAGSIKNSGQQDVSLESVHRSYLPPIKNLGGPLSRPPAMSGTRPGARTAKKNSIFPGWWSKASFLKQKGLPGRPVEGSRVAPGPNRRVTWAPFTDILCGSEPPGTEPLTRF